MNVMILSPGRRVEIIEYFKRVFGSQGGKIFALDMSPYAPALYESDQYFIIEKDFNHLDIYMDKVIEICKKYKVETIITLIDPELLLLAEYTDKFNKEGIVPIVSEIDEIAMCFDKYAFYKKLSSITSVVPTYCNYKDIVNAISKEEVTFPIVAKERFGSGSIGVGKVRDFVELACYEKMKGYIFQPYIGNREYGVDVYFDMLDGEIKSIFIKEKLAMRAGETDKAISVYRQDIVDLIMTLEQFNFRGPIDVDVFENQEGKLYINEINPRFGGGYPHAYNAGVDFVNSLSVNLRGEIVQKNVGGYKRDLIMLKFNQAKYIDNNKAN